MKKIVCSFIVLSSLSFSISSYGANQTFAQRFMTRASKFIKQAEAPIGRIAKTSVYVLAAAVTLEVLATGIPDMNQIEFYAPDQGSKLFKDMKTFTPIQAIGAGIATGGAGGFALGLFGPSELFFYLLDDGTAHLLSVFTSLPALALGGSLGTAGAVAGAGVIPAATAVVQTLDFVGVI